MNGSGMKSATGPVFFILLFSLAYGTAEAGRNIDYDLNVNGIEINVKGTEPAVPKILEPRTEEGPRKWIVQFDGPINNKDKELVVRSGCRLIDYLPEFAFTASMDGKTKKAIETLPFVRGVVRFKPAYKLSGKLTSLATSPSDGEKIRLNVLVDDQANLHQALSAVHRLKGKVLNVDPTTLLVEMETTAIADLAREEEVIWIDEHIPLQIFNDTACWTIQSFSPAATKMWSKGLHGEGQVVGIADSGVDYDMPWFRDPLVLVPGLGHRKILAYDTTYGDDFDSNDPGHGTHVAGTAVGDRTPVDGRSDANGMAPKARLFFQDISVGASLFVSPPSDLGQLFLPTHESGARLHSNSWGNSSNLYGALAASVDRFVWDHQEFLPFFANGNNGPAIGTVGNPAVAKNIVSVGASHNGTEGENVAWFSSNGPTVDGRIKPTVMAPGYSMLSADSDGIKESFNSGTIAMSGTSMATPTAAGAAALVRQYFIEGYHPSGFAAPTNSLIPSGALVKAVLINSAQNMTGSDTDSSIPSTGQGWGRINLANSLTFAGDTKKMMMVDERMGLFTDGISSTAIVVGAGQPLKVSLVWADYPGAIGASKALVNDLDLLVTAPDGTVYLGNMLTNGESRSSGSADRLNVEEQVVISTPLPGFYTVTVHGYNVPFGPQPFAWVATSGFNVPSKGVISLDRRRYPTQGEIGILVADRDLDLDTGNVDQTTIRVTSTSEPAGEQVTLAETAPDSGIFAGKLRLVSGVFQPGDGLLQVATGDTITARYLDGNDGTGQTVPIAAYAVVDTTPPVIVSLTIPEIAETSVTVDWTTDEPANGVLVYGENATTGETIVIQALANEHLAILSGLREATTYYFTLHAKDEALNEATSATQTVTTRSVAPWLSVGCSEGSVTLHETALLAGTCFDPSGVASVTVNGLPASYRASDGYFELTVQLQLGSNTFLIQANDTVGNTTIATLTVIRVKGPDLAVTALSGPTVAKTGQAVVVGYTVRTLPDGGAAPSFTVQFYLSRDMQCNAGLINLGGSVISPLAVGEQRSGNYQVTVPATVVTGSYYYCALADPSRSVGDPNWDNNRFSGSQVAVTGPDLTITAMSGPPIAKTGQLIPVEHTVLVLPDGGAAPSFAVQFYLSKEVQCSTGLISLGGSLVSPLAAGEQRSGSSQVTVPATVATGSYYYCAIIDPFGNIGETNRENNRLCGNQVTVTGPDLAVTATSGPPVAKTGQAIIVEHTVRAMPNEGATPSFIVQYYLCRTMQCSTGLISLGGSLVSPLAAGEQRSGSSEVTIPVTVAAGSYYYCAIADPFSSVGDTNPDNNTLCGNQLTLTGPDLAVTAMSGPPVAKSGQPITVEHTVRVMPDGGAAPGFTMQFSLSRTMQCSAGLISLGVSLVSPLAAGEQRSGSCQVTIPGTLATGTYYYCAIADPLSSVSDSNLQNNTLLAGALTVVASDEEGMDLLFAGNFYHSFADLCACLADGAIATVRASAVELTENLSLERNATLILVGGYDPIFSAIVGVTTLHGTVTIRDGTLIAENIAIM